MISILVLKCFENTMEVQGVVQSISKKQLTLFLKRSSTLLKKKSWHEFDRHYHLCEVDRTQTACPHKTNTKWLCYVCACLCSTFRRLCLKHNTFFLKKIVGSTNFTSPEPIFHTPFIWTPNKLRSKEERLWCCPNRLCSVANDPKKWVDGFG